MLYGLVDNTLSVLGGWVWHQSEVFDYLGVTMQGFNITLMWRLFLIKSKSCVFSRAGDFNGLLVGIRWIVRRLISRDFLWRWLSQLRQRLVMDNITDFDRRAGVIWVMYRVVVDSRCLAFGWAIWRREAQLTAGVNFVSRTGFGSKR